MRKCLIISFFVSSLLAMAQPPKRFYTKFGGNGDDIGYSVKVTLDKQYIITGLTLGVGGVGSDVLLAKMDTMGQLIWLKQLGGFNDDIGKSVVQLIDSGYVVAGYTNSFGAGGYDAYLVKTDKNGNVVWQRTFGGEDWDFANDLVVAADGSIWVVGYTTSFGSGKKDGFVLKYDNAGTLQWQKLIGGTENEELNSIIKTNDGLIATVGYTESKGEVNGDGYFLKMDLNGDTLFTRTWGGPYRDFAADVTQKSSGDYIMCGAKTFSANANTVSYMCSYTDQGVFIWDNKYPENPSDNEYFASCANSTILSYVTAYVRTRRFGTPGLQVEMFTAIHGGWPYIVNSSGGLDEEHVYSTESTKLGGYISVGSTTSFGSAGLDVYVIKHDSTIVNYSSIVSVEDQPASAITPIINIKNESISINFQNYGPKEVEIIDVNGRIISSVKTAESELTSSLSQVPTGIYILRLRYYNGTLYQKKFIRN